MKPRNECCKDKPYYIEWWGGGLRGRTVVYYYCEKHGLWEATLRTLEGCKPTSISEHLETKADELIELGKGVLGDDYKKQLTNMLALSSYHNIYSALKT